jgi:transposase
MATAAEWSTRVSAWRASGKSAREFCEGADYASNTLLGWSSRLGRRRRSGPRAQGSVQLARVVRKAEEPTRRLPVVVHVGQARIEVDADTDRSVLTMVLGVLLDAHGEDGAS